MYSDVIERLSEHTLYRHGIPGTVVARCIDGLERVFRWGWRCPDLLIECLNPFDYGRAAFTLKMLCQALPKEVVGSFDVIHCHFGPNGRRAIAERLVGAIRGPIITTFHGYDVNYFPRNYARALYRLLFRYGDLFTVGSEFMRSRLCELGAPNSRIRKVPMGISTASFPFSPRRPPDDGVINLLSVARLTEVKGIEYAIRAVAVVQQRGRKVKYTIVGDGPLRQDLQRTVSELGMNGTVAFVGAQPRDQVRKLYGESQLLVFPGVIARNGEQEGQGVVLLEAQASGLPIVATNVGGIPESVVPGESAVLVPPRDVDALADALDGMVQHPEQWPVMGRAGREYVTREFDRKVMMARLGRVYAEAASS